MLYRFTQALHLRYFRYRTRNIHTTPPLRWHPDAHCSLHTMLSSRDMPLYLVAVKSFLRFYPKVAVLVHSDGSLEEGHIQLLKQHVPGIRVIRPAEADQRAREKLGD